ncbi:MAG TPA: putative baseplate assembly protein [Longimicrobium sp.]|uniref:putative baseplate assembly protein n=1 Tax=Longimicrobium sp. TaxID=2029185 RepID=UPI002EDA012C
MSAGAFRCGDDRRRSLARNAGLNGIDFVEVGDDGVPGGEQRLLTVVLLSPPREPLRAENVSIRGGDRVRGIEVTSATGGADSAQLVVRVDQRGDFSTYTLRLHARDGGPLAWMDPRLSEVEFSFKALCPTNADCVTPDGGAPPAGPEPEIDYLARDYGSFRQLMLDRMSLVFPDWRERNPADLGVALVELLAYVGDRLSYQQDAVATEAYLGTARRRVSVRRHARLLDYAMHDGCNARAWVQVALRPGAPEEGVRLSRGTPLLTRLAEVGVEVRPDTPDHDQAMARGPEVFETLHEIQLHAAHNTLPFYTWGARDCRLPEGATAATLRGAFPQLRAGDVLVFQEVRGPRTGEPGDADPARRHPVRLTEVGVAEADPGVWLLRVKAGGLRITGREGAPLRELRPGDVLEILGPHEGTAAGGGRRWSVRAADGLAGSLEAAESAVERFHPLVTAITWHDGDALPWELCVSATTDAEHGSRHVPDVSVALGNVVLADHGRTVGLRAEDRRARGEALPTDEEAEAAGIRLLDEPEWLGAPGQADRRLAPVDGGCSCDEEPAPPPRFRPRLQAGPVTQAARIGRPAGALDADERPFFDPRGSAASALRWEMRRVLPVITLHDAAGERWVPQRDLLGSGPFSREFVVETENDGRAWLRFGDDRHGQRPSPGVPLRAVYRVGNGTAGNVGADALAHVVTHDPAVLGRIAWVRNPLAATGGTEPETMEHVRQTAPASFRDRRRAVTAEDYARAAEEHPEVQRAQATLRWTGSWRTVFLTVDRVGGRDVDAGFEAAMRAHLEPYRMAGHDLEIDAPRSVPVELDIQVCVDGAHFRGDVERDIRAVMGRRLLPDGRRGLFHPDNFTFGQSVFLSPLYAAVQAIPGVRWARVLRFRRQDAPETEAMDTGELPLDRLEVARMDDDPNHPERGSLRLRMEGGR